MAVKTFSVGELATSADVNTYLANAGLVYVAQATATTGANLDILSCLSSTFDAYRVVISNLVTAGPADVLVRLISGTNTVETTNYYSSAQYSSSWTAPTFGGLGVAGGTGQFYTSSISSNAGAVGFAFELYNPNLAARTQFVSFGAVADDAWQCPRMGYGLLKTTTQYTGIRIYTGSTFSSVTATVYGYRKA